LIKETRIALLEAPRIVDCWFPDRYQRYFPSLINVHAWTNLLLKALRINLKLVFFFLFQERRIFWLNTFSLPMFIYFNAYSLSFLIRRWMHLTGRRSCFIKLHQLRLGLIGNVHIYYLFNLFVTNSKLPLLPPRSCLFKF